MKFYFTIDADGHKIEKAAEIECFECNSKENLEKEVRKKYPGLFEFHDDLEKGITVTLEAGDFGDYWCSSYEPITKDNICDYKPFGFEELIISKPGTHSCTGSETIITPYPNVYVIVLKEEDAK